VEPERLLLIFRTRHRSAIGLALGLAVASGCGKARSSASPGPEAGRGAATSGAGGTAGSGARSGGSGADLRAVAAPLDGFVFKAPCGNVVSERLCETSTERPYPRDNDPTLVGAKLVDTSVTLGGETTALYDVTLAVEGIVEGKNYTGGEDQSQAGDLPADGFYVGGRPGGGNAASVYLLRVSDPPGDYFLNSLATDADARLRRSVFPVKYTATLRAKGGATVRLVLTDPNAHAVRNCADPDETGCAPVSHEFMDAKLRSAAGLDAEPFDGQVLGLVVTNVERAAP
jgi:hypothetical protein